MSADNGIYIAEFKDGFRVCHAQAIDNVFYGDDRKFHQAQRVLYFGRSDCMNRDQA